MLLIDSLYINNSGGLSLLHYLIDEIEKRKNDTFYLIDSRCASIFHDIPNNRKCIMKASLFNRYRWYRKHCIDYDKVLCFGNIPPQIKVKAKVYTYFHNINLLNIPNTEPVKVKIVSRFKRFIFYCLKQNTNYWIVQTTNTQSELINHLHEVSDRVKVLPFYNIVDSYQEGNNNRDGYIYASNYTPQKNFEFIIDSWDKLAELGVTPTLHLTLNKMPQKLLHKIDNANKKGAQIINHGHLNPDELFVLYRKTKAIVYAATNESLGLCLIEAMMSGCDVIAPDLPYVYCVCKPSYTFTLFSVDSFINALQKYENKPNMTINLAMNKLDELLHLLI